MRLTTLRPLQKSGGFGVALASALALAIVGLRIDPSVLAQSNER